MARTGVRRDGLIRAMVLMALAATAVAGAAFAASGRPTNPPPPAGDSAEALEAWIDDYIVTDDYLVVGRGVDEVLMFRPATVQLTPEGARAEVRGEMVKTEKLRGARTRSFQDLWDFDCRQQKAREVQSDSYPQSNLQGRPVRLDSSKETWGDPLAPDDIAYDLLKAVCQVADLLQTGADRAKAMPEAPADPLDEAEVKAWAGEHIDLAGDKLAAFASGMLIYYSPETVERSAGGLPVVWIRTELPLLIPDERGLLRSFREQDELDCRHMRMRTLARQRHVGQNLTGPAQDLGAQGWYGVAVGTIPAQVMGAICPALEPKSAQPKDIPPLDSTAPEDFAAWVSENLNLNDYVLVSATEQGVALYDQTSLNIAGKDLMHVRLRTEWTRPQSSEDGAFRSALQSAEIDCRGNRYRTLESTAYALNNAEGAVVTREETGPWRTPGAESNARGMIEQVCSQAGLLTGEVDLTRAILPRPVSTDEDGVQAWIDENIDVGDDVFAAYSEESVQFYSATRLEQMPSGSVRVYLRTEFFEPRLFGSQVLRSTQGLMEFDCAEHRHRILKLEGHAGANLLGPVISEAEPPSEWAYIEPGTILSATAGAACEAALGGDDDDPVAPTSSRKSL